MKNHKCKFKKSSIRHGWDSSESSGSEVLMKCKCGENYWKEEKLTKFKRTMFGL